MFYLTYLYRELRRRAGRTLLTVIGLALGVGLVAAITSISQGLDQAQKDVLNPLGQVGTDLMVTRPVGASTEAQQGQAQASQPTEPGPGGPEFFAGRGQTALSREDQQALMAENQSVITDLSKLGKAGDKFVHDFFMPATQLTFASDQADKVGSLSGVAAVGKGLTLLAVHQEGTVPEIYAEFQTGGETVEVEQDIAPPTEAERAAMEKCMADARQKAGTDREAGRQVFAKCIPERMQRFRGRFTTPERTIRQLLNPPQTDITSQTYTIAGVDLAVPGLGLITKAQITRGSFFSAASAATASASSSPSPSASAVSPGVSGSASASPSSTSAASSVASTTTTTTTSTTTTTTTTAPVSATASPTASASSGAAASPSPSASSAAATSTGPREVVLSEAYAERKSISLGDDLNLNGTIYKVVGLAKPPLGGQTADVYLPLSELQTLSSREGRVNVLLVRADSASNVSGLESKVAEAFPGAQVTSAADMAEQVSGSLMDAANLANRLGLVLGIVVLAAAFMIASLLTLSSVTKRVRELGTLRAIGWRKGLVVRQVMIESLVQGLLGGVVGMGLGVAAALGIAAFSPALKATAASATTSSVGGGFFGLGQVATNATETIKLHAPISLSMLGLAIGLAVVGGLVAGAVGALRASRLRPAAALRTIG
ncbi:MAG: FtsX-like permease family protein [Actinomycetota bacterium]